jgi:hypothetical protein
MVPPKQGKIMIIFPSQKVYIMCLSDNVKILNLLKGCIFLVLGGGMGKINQASTIFAVKSMN